MRKCIILALCSLSFSALADQGSNASLKRSENSLKSTNAMYSVGMSTKLDVLLAEKNLLDIKLCQNSNDVESFRALAENVNERLNLVNSYYSAGSVSKISVDYLQNEKIMHQNNCLALLKITQLNYKCGYVYARGCEFFR